MSTLPLSPLRVLRVSRSFMYACCFVTAGQLLRHYSPDLEVFRVLGATSSSTSGRIDGVGELADLVDMARWVIHCSIAEYRLEICWRVLFMAIAS